MRLKSLVMALAGTCAMSAVATASAADYIIVANGDALPADIYTKVGAAGGYLDKVYDFGIGIARSDDAAFAEKLFDTANIKEVIRDVGYDIKKVTDDVADDSTAGEPPNSGNDDERFDFQWGHNYVGAQEAWDAGYRGQGVRVAVLDGGFDLDHPDLAPNINLGLSADFTGEGLQYGFPDPFSHGSHVAGTIAAADNGIGTIGVAPEAELVLVKVLGDAGSGSFANIIAGIYHAASVDADVINMSLGVIIPRQGQGSGNADISALANAVNKAITYAHQSGTTVVVSAGNAAYDLDGDGGAVRFNTGMSHAVGISALTTLNWAGDPANQTLAPASYTNFGTSMVDFSAPGGSGDYPGNETCQVSNRVLPCWVFDLVYSTGNNGWYWSAGTSMAAPHAAGVAALIISENGGDMDPAAVIREMRKRASDGGKPGRDDYYGHGIVNSGH